MKQEKYIGMDVHAATISAAVVKDGYVCKSLKGGREIVGRDGQI
jgi:hypothetical protein